MQQRRLLNWRERQMETKMTIGNKQDSRSLTIAATAPARGARLFWAALIAAALIQLAPRHAAATPAYAAQTGKPCSYCHVDPKGGGALTPEGKEFAKGPHLSLINFSVPARSPSVHMPNTEIRTP
jgi:hypothetical protein